MGIEQFDQLSEISQGACQAIDLVDDNDIDPVRSDVVEELLQGRAVGGSAREAAIVISGSNQCPTGMGLAADIGLRRIILGIKRVEVLIKAGLCRHAGIDGAAHVPSGCSCHDLVSTAIFSRRPKNRGPFQLVPVIAKATFDRLS
jgi:hypothetical protein